MSLYADEDLGQPSSASSYIQASSSTAAAQSTLDPVNAFATAASLPAESPEQAAAFTVASERFEQHPERLPELCASLLQMTAEGGESLLRSWSLDMVALAVGRSSLQVDVKSTIAQQSLDALNRLLHTGGVSTIKAVIPIFSTIHAILFRILATSRPPQQIYDAFRSSKLKILSFVLDPNAQPQNRGVKAAAWKFLQKVLLAGTRAPAADPRLQRGNAIAQDVSIAMINPNGVLNAAELEEEAKLLQTQLVTQMFSSSDPAVIQPIFHTIPILCKSRPHLAALLVPSMSAWTPAALEASGRPAMQVRAVEKTLRLVMVHLARTSSLVNFHAQLNEALMRQKQRIDAAWTVEVEERAARKMQAQARLTVRPVQVHTVSVPGGAKHTLEPESSADGAKRAKLEAEGSGWTKGPEVDISAAPMQLVVQGAIDGLRSIHQDRLKEVILAAKQAISDDTPQAICLLAPLLGVSKGQPIKQDPEADDEILNPLDMDMDDEDLLLADTLPEEEEDEAITVTEFHLPPPGPLEASEKEELVTSALSRICLSGDELAGLPNIDVKDGVALAVQPKEAWMLLMARLATRGVGKRKAVSDYISADFSNRSKFAAVWLNEEWYSDLLNKTSHYPTHLDTVLAALIATVDAKDRSLSTFLTLLPEITPSVISTLTTLCLEPERGIVGFIALRELIETRPPVRQVALGKLLELCTHPDRKIRYPAIRTVNRWVPDSPMAEPTIAYALGIMRRLISSTSEMPISDGDDVKMDQNETIKAEDGVEQSKPVLSASRSTSPFINEVNEDTVQQHVELAFALSRKKQELLTDIFALYPPLEPPITDAVESLLTPLIQSLGPSAKLLDVLRHFPEGADRLALRVVQILSSEGASVVLVNLIKGLMSERELDPKFIIPIIGELDKTEIEKQIPRIVSLLGTSESRDLVRTAFAAALQKLTPADLLVSLHDEESGRKATIEAIGICFSMTTVFRSDVLATSLSRITDLPTLPVVFLRTTIQAVSTYKSLIPFIANNILPKLIVKKVYDNPPLWDGFVRLAKMIAPASFGSLLQLPKEWLRDVLVKQPGIKQGLKTHLESKGMLKDDVAELFGEANSA